MGRLFFIFAVIGALLVPGCRSAPKGGRPERSQPDSISSGQNNPALLRAGLDPIKVTSTTVRSVDTTKLSDTARAITVSTVTKLDSTRVERISLPAELEGIPYGPTEAPLKTLCDSAYGYTGTVLGIGKARWVTVMENGAPVQRQDTAANRARNALMQAELDSAAACKAKAILRIPRKALSDPLTGKLSVAEALREIRTWPKSWAQHPAFFAFHLGDDPADPAWGYTMGVRMVMWDSIACGTAQRFDTPTKKAPTWLRARPIQMEAIGTVRGAVPVDQRWQCMTTAMAQWVHRLGEPNAFFQKEIASAKKQKLGFVSALNLLSGGCGNKPATTRPLNAACYATGTDRRGATTGTYQMGVGEITLVGEASLDDRYVCSSQSWSWWENWKSPGLPDSLQVQNIPENKIALLELSKKAKQHPATSCIQR